MINLIKAADKDGSGFLNVAELKELLLKMSPEDKVDVDKNVDMFIRMASTDDGDKKIKIEEAIKLFTSKEEEDPKEMMKTTFRMYDCDGDGFISKIELANFWNSDDDDDAETNQMIQMMMELADEDEDGKL